MPFCGWIRVAIGPVARIEEMIDFLSMGGLCEQMTTIMSVLMGAHITHPEDRRDKETVINKTVKLT